MYLSAWPDAIDWRHLIELCGMVGAVVIDMDGVYDPNLINDRLLLGLKGTMSEFEATLIRQRSIEAIHQKARRGELWIPVPVGFCWTPNGKIEKHPDQRGPGSWMAGHVSARATAGRDRNG